MKRAVAAAMAALMACQGCALRSGHRTGRVPDGGRPLTISTEGERPAVDIDRVAAARVRWPARSGRQQPRVLSTPAEWNKYLERFPIGAKVKVTLAGGDELRAIFMGLEGDRVTVRPRTRIPEPARVIPLASLSWMELDQGTSIGKTVGIAAAVAGGTVLAIFLILLATIDD
ncbi:MAG: hypothetical protein ACM3NQ_19805 [Bacteroidales bacterium]